MVFAAMLRGVAVPIVHAHEHMPSAPISASGDVAVVATDCDPASHAAATDAAVDAACDGMTHQHASTKSKPGSERTAKICSGDGLCCGVLLSLEAAAAAAPDKYMPESVRIVTPAGVEPAGLDRPPSRLSV